MTCAKKKVTCYIVTQDQKYTIMGTNDCDQPQQTCPRLTGEGYEKCKSICKQPGHAEEMAIKQAEEMGVSLEGATAFIQGIDHYCKTCQQKLRAAGVECLGFVK